MSFSHNFLTVRGNCTEKMCKCSFSKVVIISGKCSFSKVVIISDEFNEFCCLVNGSAIVIALAPTLGIKEKHRNQRCGHEKRKLGKEGNALVGWSW